MTIAKTTFELDRGTNESKFITKDKTARSVEHYLIVGLKDLLGDDLDPLSPTAATEIFAGACAAEEFIAAVAQALRFC